MGIRKIALTFAAAVTLAVAGSSVAVSAPSPGPAGPAEELASVLTDPRFDPSWPRYRFRSTDSSLTMDARFSGGPGSAVQLWGNNSGDAQLWVAERAREGGDFLHPGYDRWLCLDFNGDRRYGAPIQVNTCDGSDSQRWYYFGHPLGGVDITSHIDHQFCIDVPSSNFVAGQQLQLWGCNSGAAQQWR